MALHSVTDKACIANSNRYMGMVTLESPGAWEEEVAWRGSAELAVTLFLRGGLGTCYPCLLSFHLCFFHTEPGMESGA